MTSRIFPCRIGSAYDSQPDCPVYIPAYKYSEEQNHKSNIIEMFIMCVCVSWGGWYMSVSHLCVFCGVTYSWGCEGLHTSFQLLIVVICSWSVNVKDAVLLFVIPVVYAVKYWCRINTKDWCFNRNKIIRIFHGIYSMSLFTSVPPFQYKDRLFVHRISIIKIIIFMMRIPTLLKRHLYIETAPILRRSNDIKPNDLEYCVEYHPGYPGSY